MYYVYCNFGYFQYWYIHVYTLFIMIICYCVVVFISFWFRGSDCGSDSTSSWNFGLSFCVFFTFKLGLGICVAGHLSGMS